MEQGNNNMNTTTNNNKQKPEISESQVGVIENVIDNTEKSNDSKKIIMIVVLAVLGVALLLTIYFALIKPNLKKPNEPTPIDPTPVDPTPVDPTPIDPTGSCAMCICVLAICEHLDNGGIFWIDFRDIYVDVTPTHMHSHNRIAAAFPCHFGSHHHMACIVSHRNRAYTT